MAFFKPVVVLLLAFVALALCQVVESEFNWYSTALDDDFGREDCDGEEVMQPDYYVDNDNVVYYYFYGLDIPALESANGASSLTPVMLVTCAAALVAQFV
jgi:hypothetical protein